MRNTQLPNHFPKQLLMFIMNYQKWNMDPYVWYNEI